MSSGSVQLKAVLAALTEDVSPNPAANYLPTYNASGNEAKKIKLQTLLDAIGAGGADWGDIGGTLSDQTDLQAALDAKAPTTRAINTGTGLTGGGNLTANRTLALDINGQTEETSAAGGDFILIWDVSAGALRKMSRTNFLAGIGASSPLTLTANSPTETPFTIVGAGGQSVNLAVIGAHSAFNSAGDYISNDGQIQMNYSGGLRGGWHPTQCGYIVCPGWGFGFSAANNFNTIDVAFVRAAAGIVRISDGPLGSTGGGALQFTEMSAPSAPGANNVIFYAEDNGSGKTRVMAKYSDGSTSQVTIQP
jgi:hypothetical protein